MTRASTSEWRRAAILAAAAAVVLAAIPALVGNFTLHMLTASAYYTILAASWNLLAGFMAPRLKCYLLDEPFAGVNPVIKDAIVELIEAHNREHRTTFVVVSHEMAVVRRLCRRVTVMIEGRIGAEGTLDEVAGKDEVIGAYLGKIRT